MQVVLSLTVMLVDLSVAILQLEVSTALIMQMKVSSNDFIFLSQIDTHIS